MNVRQARAGILPFIKMHGIGNDYIYLDCVNRPMPSDLPSLARRLSDRHRSIGGDGIITVGPPTAAGSDFTMRIFNADGSEARMCGNGIRCVGKLVYDHGLTDRLTLRIDTMSGLRTVNLHPGPDGLIEAATVAMGVPEIGMIDTEVDGIPGVKLTAVSTGNPHGVVIVGSGDQTDVASLGPRLETHPMWPDRANIEFVEIVSRSHVRMRVWERGSGETMACGTGACASVAACVQLGLTDSRVRVSLAGGDLDISWPGPGEQIMMTGPAAESFQGTVKI